MSMHPAGMRLPLAGGFTPHSAAMSWGVSRVDPRASLVPEHDEVGSPFRARTKRCSAGGCRAAPVLQWRALVTAVLIAAARRWANVFWQQLPASGYSWRAASSTSPTRRRLVLPAKATSKLS